VGLAISIFQAVTQIQESTLTFVPKILASFLILVVAGPWMTQMMVDYSGKIFEQLIQLAQAPK
jgi:flagellar biosynthetic protein FliQ